MAETEVPLVRTRRGKVYYFLIALSLLIVIGICWYRSGSPRVTFNLGGVAHAVAFSPDGKILATGNNLEFGDGFITLWDVSTHRQIIRWATDKDFITGL